MTVGQFLGCAACTILLVYGVYKCLSSLNGGKHGRM